MFVQNWCHDLVLLNGRHIFTKRPFPEPGLDTAENEDEKNARSCSNRKYVKGVKGGVDCGRCTQCQDRIQFGSIPNPSGKWVLDTYVPTLYTPGPEYGLWTDEVLEKSFWDDDNASYNGEVESWTFTRGQRDNKPTPVPKVDRAQNSRQTDPVYDKVKDLKECQEKHNFLKMLSMDDGRDSLEVIDDYIVMYGHN